mmetsp:Transcript_23737/g.68245  ORF Transcript_23737/g.68245 Transcript_23737/m.68245 type:complete len:232 (+) Transcript_23737:665-1360(+)
MPPPMPVPTWRWPRETAPPPMPRPDCRQCPPDRPRSRPPPRPWRTAPWRTGPGHPRRQLPPMTDDEQPSLRDRSASPNSFRPLGRHCWHRPRHWQHSRHHLCCYRRSPRGECPSCCCCCGYGRLHPRAYRPLARRALRRRPRLPTNLHPSADRPVGCAPLATAPWFSAEIPQQQRRHLYSRTVRLRPSWYPPPGTAEAEAAEGTHLLPLPRRPLWASCPASPARPAAASCS